jgi:small GTP-binding protein
MRGKDSINEKLYDKNDNTETVKAVVVGDIFRSGRPGKSAFIETLMEESILSILMPDKSPIGVDFRLRKIHVDGHNVRVQLWDIAGQERFRNMNRVYYRDAKIAFIVCDLNEINTFHSVPMWDFELAKNMESSYTKVLIFFNSQSPAENNRNYSADELNAFIQKYNIDGYFFADPRVHNDEPLRFALRKHFENMNNIMLA